MNRQQTWSIFIFTFNEKGNVERVVEQALNVLPRLSTDYELIIVDDGSTDGSEKFLAETAAGDDRIKYIRHEPNRGIGNALHTGYTRSVMENVCAVPGDAQFDLEELLQCPEFAYNEFLTYFREKKNYNLWRTFLTWFNLWVNARILNLHIHDVNWVKVFKRDQLADLPISVRNSPLIQSEMCAKLQILGYSAREIPSVYHTREHGSPKGGSFRTVKKAIDELLVLTREVRRFKKGLKGKTPKTSGSMLLKQVIPDNQAVDTRAEKG